MSILGRRRTQGHRLGNTGIRSGRDRGDQLADPPIRPSSPVWTTSTSALPISRCTGTGVRDAVRAIHHPNGKDSEADA
ncbi:hypothetical protein ACFVYP_34280 [Kitasatospora sp. NPDC058201]|uniref:hypothetical protein n=1 Tax=unclassified Kitasatospora TaxID=2633591 RepID=UPI003649A1B1